MDIEIHGLNVVTHSMSEDDIIDLFSVLHINLELFQSKTFGNAREFKYSFVDKESVYIRYNIDSGYVMINLHGSFFDNSPDFRLRKFLKFISRHKHTMKQLDVAFTDDKKYLNIKTLRYWCRNSKQYCTGSIVSNNIPKTVYAEGKFDRIQLGSASSKVNFGTIYVRQDTKLIRIEIKVKKKEKIEYILENYSTKNLQLFETRSLETLVSCINFVRVQSKRNRVKAKYKKQPSWESFLESKVDDINWRKIHEERLKNRSEADEATFEKRISRQATMLKNMIIRSMATHPEEDVLRLLSELSGYHVKKRLKEHDSCYHLS